MKHLRDEATLHVEDAYLKAERRAAYFMRRGYWRAAERWAGAAAALYQALSEVGWTRDAEDRTEA